MVQADTVMYSNNIVAAKEEEMLNLKFSVSVLPFLSLVICFNVGQAVLLAIWRTSGYCLPLPIRGFAPALRGSQRNLNTHMRSGCRRDRDDEEENKDRKQSGEIEAAKYDNVLRMQRRHLIKSTSSRIRSARLKSGLVTKI